MSTKTHREEVRELKRRHDFEKSVPRCETCIKYSKPKTLLTRNSKALVIPPKCAMLGIDVKPASVCRMWEDQTGHVLRERIG